MPEVKHEFPLVESPPREFDSSLLDDHEKTQAAQHSFSPEEEFEFKLIEAVEKNPCLYNRSHRLNKMADYKTHVWNQIAKELHFAGEGIELERKWKNMRDKFVRLRKLVNASQPLETDSKWYIYYHKMLFLDPYIEHRNRKKRGSFLNNSLSDTTEAHDSHADPVLDDLRERHDDEASDSAEGEADVDPLKGFYASFLPTASSTGGGLLMEQASPVIPSARANSWSSCDSRGPTPAKKGKVQTTEEDVEESEVSLFVRSIEKTLNSMDPQQFALARLEISRVLYECQFGRKTK